MRSGLSLLGLMSLFTLLPCRIWAPGVVGQPAEPRFSAAVDGPHGPGAVECVIARFNARQSSLASFEIREVAEAVVREAEINELAWDLVLAVIHTESGFYNFANSSAGALGLMQIMPKTGEALAREAGVEWHGAETLFEPLVNVKLGTRYLAMLHGRFGGWEQALAAYNWGPGAIDRRLRRGHRLPRRYVAKIYSQLRSPDAL